MVMATDAEDQRWSLTKNVHTNYGGSALMSTHNVLIVLASVCSVPTDTSSSFIIFINSYGRMMRNNRDCVRLGVLTEPSWRTAVQRQMAYSRSHRSLVRTLSVLMLIEWTAHSTIVKNTANKWRFMIVRKLLCKSSKLYESHIRAPVPM